MTEIEIYYDVFVCNYKWLKYSKYEISKSCSSLFQLGSSYILRNKDREYFIIILIYLKATGEYYYSLYSNNG